MPTLILSQRFSNDSNTLWRAAIARGWDVERLRGYAVPASLAARDPVLYGETLTADAMIEALGVDFIEPSHDWLPSLPPRHLRREVRLATLGEARALSAPAFIKGVDEKIVPARVYERGEDVDPAHDFPDDEHVLIAEPVRFGIEVRAFVLDREVRALSAYIRDGQLARDKGGGWLLSAAEEEAARACLSALLADPAVELPPACVVDVGEIAGRGWAVIEANPCWASGLCGCDPCEVLDVLRRAVVQPGCVGDVDSRWLRRRHR